MKDLHKQLQQEIKNLHLDIEQAREDIKYYENQIIKSIMAIKGYERAIKDRELSLETLKRQEPHNDSF